jgi:hypothetical protein
LTPIMSEQNPVVVAQRNNVVCGLVIIQVEHVIN